MKRRFAVGLALLLMLSGSVARADKHALLIALGSYEDKRFGTLPALNTGAKGLSQVLEKQGVPADHIEMLAADGKQKPTQAAIKDALKRLSERVKKDDEVWVFYYGHGIELSGVSYLSCYDSKLDSMDALKRSSVSAREFVAPLSKIPASLLVMGLEACRSEYEGANSDGTVPDGVRKVDFNLAVPEGKPGPRRVATFFSSKTNTTSYILPDRSLGVFISCVIRGLKGDAADATGTVRVKNLGAFLEKAVPGTAFREYGTAQMPEVLAFGDGVQDAILTKGHAPYKGGETALPAKVGDSTEDKWAAEFQQGYELREAKKIDDALKHFKTAADLKPEDTRAQGLIGAQFYQLGRYAEAEAFFKRALKDSSPNPAGFMYLGLIREHQGKLDDAETYYRRSYEIGKSWQYTESAYYFARFLYYYRHDYKQSEKLLREALKMEPNQAGAQVLLARVLVQGENRKKFAAEIRKLLTDAMKFYPNYAEAHFALGQWHYYVKDDADNAIKAYTKTLELEPDYDSAMSELAHIYYEKEDGKASAEWSRKAIALRPEVGENYVSLAYALYVLNDLDEARKAAKKAVELGSYDKDVEIFGLLNVKPETKPDSKPAEKKKP